MELVRCRFNFVLFLLFHGEDEPAVIKRENPGISEVTRWLRTWL